MPGLPEPATRAARVSVEPTEMRARDQRCRPTVHLQQRLPCHRSSSSSVRASCCPRAICSGVGAGAFALVKPALAIRIPARLWTAVPRHPRAVVVAIAGVWLSSGLVRGLIGSRFGLGQQRFKHLPEPLSLLCECGFTLGQRLLSLQSFGVSGCLPVSVAAFSASSASLVACDNCCSASVDSFRATFAISLAAC